MIRLLLDNMLTPRGVDFGWACTPPVDIIHVGYRSMPAASDASIWAYAATEARSVVTINAYDYWHLATNANSHHYGLFLMEPGYPREGQLQCLSGICSFANAEDAACRCLNDRVVCADVRGVTEVDVADRSTIEFLLGVTLSR